jgi:hypothetical protein
MTRLGPTTDFDIRGAEASDSITHCGVKLQKLTKNRAPPLSHVSLRHHPNTLQQTCRIMHREKYYGINSPLLHLNRHDMRLWTFVVIDTT